MRILIAPNAFKNSLPAEDVAEAIEEGLLMSNLKCDCIKFPIGDGGDGTGKLLTNHLNGASIGLVVHDPVGRTIEASMGWVEKSHTAIIEMANASGLKLMRPDELDPLRAISFGTGEMIRHALNLKSKNIFLAVGGTATVDGGCGILKALGVRFLDVTGSEIIDLPRDLVRLESLDLSGIDQRIHQTKITVLCDVNNPLLGPLGAANVFGPQKGATPEQIVLLERGLKKLSTAITKATGKAIDDLDRGGAAGGVGAALNGLLNANLVSGIDQFLDATHFNEKLKNVDVLITGEGALDNQTLQGKAPFGVAKRAKDKHIFVVALAGSVPADNNSSFKAYFDLIISINEGSNNLVAAMRDTRENLIRTARETGNLLAARSIRRRYHGTFL
jgi:glycerate kinase